MKRAWSYIEWPVVGCLGIAALVLGYIGFARYWAQLGEVRSPFDLFYLSLQLFVLESGYVQHAVPFELQVARYLAPGVAAYTAVQAFAVIFRDQLEMLRVRFLQNHVVICGLGQKGLLLAQRFCEQGDRVVVIEKEENNDFIAGCKGAGAVVLTGTATDRTMLKKVQVQKAKYLISVCGDDGVNVEVAVHASKLVKNRRKTVLTCIIHIVEPQLHSLLRQQEIAALAVDCFRLDFFNIFDRGARAMLAEFPVTGKAVKANQSPHVLVLGMGRMGESLVVCAARQWHEEKQNRENKLRITVIDNAAEQKLALLCLKYPRLTNYCDFELRQIDVNSPVFYQAGFLFDSQARMATQNPPVMAT